MRTPGRLPGLHSGVGLALLIILCATTIACLLMFPFDFNRNGVSWLDGRPGLYFNGRGIAHTAQRFERSSGEPLDEMTFELWVRERPSERRGSGVVLSLYDGSSTLPVALGIHRGRVFAFDLDEPWPSNWMEQFLAAPILAPGEEHLIAVTVDRSQKSIFVGGELADRRLRQNQKKSNWLASRLVLGTSPENYEPWEGELLGLAIYGQILSDADLKQHEIQTRGGGVHTLAGDGRLLALFPFEEGAGDLAHNLVAGEPGLRIPAWFVGLPDTLFDAPARQHFSVGSFLRNIPANVVLFAPLGWLLGIAVARAPADRQALLALAAIAGGGLVSFGLEAAQLWLPTRQTGLLDVLANTLGTALGTVAALAWQRRERRTW